MSKLQESFDNNLALIKKKYELNLERVAIAVSGGADSLALAFLLLDYAEKYDIKIAALTVNHHLRAESSEEAEYVHNLMESVGVEHHVLNWFSSNPKSGIEEKAREARYSLLEDWCYKNNYKNMLTAHHQKDQAETFLMRLQRGSGVDGLASMGEFSVRGRINIIRPLLSIMPEDLQKYLENRGINWMYDSSNECDDFLRVRIRKMLPILEKELGISVKRIACTAAALGSVRDYFEQQVNKFIKSNVKIWDNCAVSFYPKTINSLHQEIKTRVLSTLIKKIGKTDYPPTYEELTRLSDAVVNPDFKGCTLGKCEIIKFQNKIWIVKQLKEKKELLKSEWEDFIYKNNEYKDIRVPYKLKIFLVKGNEL